MDILLYIPSDVVVMNSNWVDIVQQLINLNIEKNMIITILFRLYNPVTISDIQELIQMGFEKNIQSLLSYNNSNNWIDAIRQLKQMGFENQEIEYLIHQHKFIDNLYKIQQLEHMNLNLDRDDIKHLIRKIPSYMSNFDWLYNIQQLVQMNYGLDKNNIKDLLIYMPYGTINSNWLDKIKQLKQMDLGFEINDIVKLICGMTESIANSNWPYMIQLLNQMGIENKNIVQLLMYYGRAINYDKLYKIHQLNQMGFDFGEDNILYLIVKMPEYISNSDWLDKIKQLKQMNISLDKYIILWLLSRLSESVFNSNWLDEIKELGQMDFASNDICKILNKHYDKLDKIKQLKQMGF